MTGLGVTDYMEILCRFAPLDDGLAVTDYMEFLRRFAPLDDGLGSYRLYGVPSSLRSSG